MLDVSRKSTTLREAHARAKLTLKAETAQLIRDGKVPKGDALTVAKVAAIHAAKNTSNIIPYCHPMPVEFVGVEFDVADNLVTIDVRVKAIHRTGVEMEALTAAGVAALTLYDMLKMLDETMSIQGVELIGKSGGKSSFREEFPRQLKASVLVLSDSVTAGKKSDKSGQLIRERLVKEGLDVVDYSIVSDDVDGIVSAVTRYADELKLDLVVTTGGTGLGPRDNAPEALAQVIERPAPGISEAARAHGQERTHFAMLSRGVAGLRGQTLIVALPGSTKAVEESLDGLLPGLLHAFRMIHDMGHDAEGKGAAG